MLMLVVGLLGLAVLLAVVFLVRRRQAGKRWKRATIFRTRDGYRKRLLKKKGLEYIQFRAVVDKKACPDCLELHGKIFPKEESLLIPICPGCRCEYVGVGNDLLPEARLEEKSLQEIAGKELERRTKL